MTTNPSKIGRYELREQIGKGGMALVFKAYDPYFEREVAIKLLSRELLSDPAFRARFVREARIIALLEHPAIVPVYDFGEHEDQPYLVMRYIAGGTLTQRLQDSTYTIEEALPILHRLASALDEAHAKGIVHRDVKPSNVLFDGHGQAYLMDFGIAKLIFTTQTILTHSSIVGTPAYMSPEQAQGLEQIDRHSDVYSLGVIIFEMLAGRRPFECKENPLQLALMHVSEPVPHITHVNPRLPRLLNTVIMRAMAKLPEERYDSAGELVRAVEGTRKVEVTFTQPNPDDTPTERVLAEPKAQASFHHADGTVIPVHHSPFTIGRKPEMDLDLAKWDAPKFVSRLHATLTLEKGVWTLRHAEGARNPTRINGQLLLPEDAKPLSNGDEVYFAMVAFTFRIPGKD